MLELIQRQPQRRSRFASASVSLLLAVSLLAAPGCGGSGNSSPGTAVPGSVTTPAIGRGQVRFTIKWPERATTRLVPQAAESIKFICKDADDDDELIREQVVARGQTVVTLDLPSVHVRIDGEACANADGTGQVLAKGGVTVKVQETKVAAQKLTLDSVIKEVKLHQSDISVSGDQAVEVNADALDAEGAVVLTTPGNWEWTPEDPAAGEIVEYQPTGSRLLLRAKKDGAAAFVVKEKETGHTARLAVASDAPEPPQVPEPDKNGYFTDIPLTNLRVGEIVQPRLLWRAPNGSVAGPDYGYYGRDPGGVWGLVEGSNYSPKPLVALKQGVTTLPIYSGAYIHHAPVKVSGYLLSVTVRPGANGEARAIEVSIDDRMVIRATPQGNSLGRVTEYDTYYTTGDLFHTTALPVPMELTPGQHKLTVKDVSEDSNPDYKVAFKARIVNVHDLNSTVEKDGSKTEFFTIP